MFSADIVLITVVLTLCVMRHSSPISWHWGCTKWVSLRPHTE